MEPFDELQVRRDRLSAIQASGVDPYPSVSLRTHTIALALAQFEDLQSQASSLTLAGRILAVRGHGGSTFITIADGTGKLQLYVKKDEVGQEGYRFLEKLDVGDFVEATGKLFLTHRGERSLMVSERVRLLTKTLRPLPEKWHGLTDTEIRYRKRYLDLLANEEVKAVAMVRSVIVRELRNFFDERGFVEVETPVLQSIPGGATARPFATHLNALDIDLYLRVAPELYLKRLLVAGLPKVYEVARCFRNEGMDHSHNPEFTQVELYEAFANYRSLMTLLEELLTTLVLKTKGSLVIPFAGGTIDFTPPYPTLDWMTALNTALGVDTETLDDEKFRSFLREKGVEVMDHEGRGAMLDAAYKKFVRPTIVQPTFFIDHPVELSPLSKRHHDNPKRVERFQLVIGAGIELVNGFSELNDPIDQRARFEEQEKLRAAGDVEAQRIDDDFIEALEHGMPPAAGAGIGIDRLVAVLTNQHSLKEVILFPTLRPKGEKVEEKVEEKAEEKEKKEEKKGE